MTRERERLRAFVRERLTQRFFVRLHMSVIVAAVVLAGAGLSKLLLTAGLTSLPVRYALAVLGSYVVFFFMVRLWLWHVTGRAPQADDDAGDPGLDGFDAVDWCSGSGSGGSSGLSPGGGGFGGGGASSSWGEASASRGSSGSGSSGSGLDLDLDGEGLLVLALLIAVVAAVVLSGAYVIYQAPAILGEVAFEFLLASGLIRASRRIPIGEWSTRLLRATWVPLLIVTLVTISFGVAAQRRCPRAAKVAEVWECVRGNR